MQNVPDFLSKALCARRAWICAGAVATLVAGAAACSSFSANDAPDGDGGVGDGGSDATATSDGNDGGDGIDASFDATPLPPLPPLAVFVTSQAHDGGGFGTGVGGLAGADAFCTTLAEADGGIPGRKWVAWLSTSGTDARTRLPNSGEPLRGPYVLPGDSGVVFPRGFSFEMPDGSPGFPLIPINVDEQGGLQLSVTVWTGTNDFGRRWTGGDAFCSNWTQFTDGGTLIGTTGSSDQAWTGTNNTPDCTLVAHLYCFELP